jgi:hypothetical protein
MSSDGGRDFLSTKEPVRKDSSLPANHSAKQDPATEDPPFGFSDLLKQFYPGRTGK